MHGPFCSLPDCERLSPCTLNFYDEPGHHHSSPPALLAEPSLNLLPPYPGFRLSACTFSCKNQLTSLISLCLSSTWSFYLPLIGTLINLGLLYWKRHSHPLNYVLLSTFTLM